MLLDLDAVTRNELASMIYARWSQAYDKVKEVKAMTWTSANKFCPKADWPSCHGHMLHNAQAELELAAKLKDAVCKYSPIVIGE